jgi:SAM-dependent methyltransferase
MRRYVADFARAPRGVRVLDFGSGAGWVGVEAAKRLAARELCAFDPSPEMVRITGENAQAEGIERFTGRTGFGEDPPFPAAGEAPIELVLSSGVASFSPDLERWLDGLARTVAPGGELVIGDIHREARGFRRRRAERPLLPVREMNARTRAELRAGLEARGFTHEASAGYQLTRPVPELMHLSETKLHGLLSRPLLWSNQLAASLDRALGGRCDDQFDSWVMRLRRR